MRACGFVHSTFDTFPVNLTTWSRLFCANRMMGHDRVSQTDKGQSRPARPQASFSLNSSKNHWSDVTSRR